MAELMLGRFVPIRVQPKEGDGGGRMVREAVLHRPLHVGDQRVVVAGAPHRLLHSSRGLRAHTPCLAAITVEASSPEMLRSGAVGAVMPSNVSNRWRRRRAPTSLSVRATAIMLPPFHTPHSTMSPGMLCVIASSTA